MIAAISTVAALLAGAGILAIAFATSTFQELEGLVSIGFGFLMLAVMAAGSAQARILREIRDEVRRARRNTAIQSREFVAIDQNPEPR